MKYDSASHAFAELTSKLLNEKFVYSESVNFRVCKEEKTVDECLDRVFAGRTAWKYGTQLPWRIWLLELGFPSKIYDEHECSLESMIQDERVWQQNYRSRNSTHSFFGRLCRPQLSGQSYMAYFLERFKDENLRSYPNFYFDVEPMAWIWEELMRNKTQPKSGRGAATCCSNIWFRWNPKKQSLAVGWIMKHAMWSHLYQDIFSPIDIAMAICEELNLRNAEVSVFFCSLKLDEPKTAKKFMEYYEEACKKKIWTGE